MRELGMDKAVRQPDHALAIGRHPAWEDRVTVFHPGLIAMMDGHLCAGHLLDGIQRPDMIPVPMRDQDQGNFPGVKFQLLQVVHKSLSKALCARIDQDCPFAAQQIAVTDPNGEALKGEVHGRYPCGCDWCHSQALVMISRMLSCWGFQPSSRFIFSEEATRRAASPGRRGSSRVGIGCPVTWRAVSITWRTEYPLPLPRL